MGAENIDFKIKGKASKAEIEKKFKEQQAEDREYNGSQGGYSGDFQTVSGVDFRLTEIFEDLDKAYNYCLENAEKWDYVVAVYYKDSKGEVNTLVAGWGAC